PSASACFTSGHVINSNSTSGCFLAAGGFLAGGACANAVADESATATAVIAVINVRCINDSFFGGHYNPPVPRVFRLNPCMYHLIDQWLPGFLRLDALFLLRSRTRWNNAEPQEVKPIRY